MRKEVVEEIGGVIKYSIRWSLLELNLALVGMK